MRDADSILRTKRVHDGYRPVRREYLHRACCDVADLLNEIGKLAPLVAASDGGLGLTMLGSGHGSDIRLYLEGGAESSVYCLAGDSAYSILPVLIKPYSNRVALNNALMQLLCLPSLRR